MQGHARFTFFCASILLAYPALAGILSEQGTGQGDKAKPAQHMTTRKTLSVLILLLCSALTFPVAAELNNDPGTGDSAPAAGQQRRQVEIQMDQQQTASQRAKRLGKAGAQFTQGLVSGKSEERKKIPIQADASEKRNNPKSPNPLDSLFSEETGGAAAPEAESARAAAKPANSLDSLFDKETGGAATPGAGPARSATKQIHGLDDLLEQEQADEASQRKLAEEKRIAEEKNRKAEEQKQRRLAEEKRRREEAQRLAEQRQREIDDERDAARRKRQSTVDAGLFGAAVGFATGNRNIGAIGLTQALTGEEADTHTLNQAAQSDQAEQKRKADAEARASEAEAARIERMHRQQEQAADQKVKEDTRQIDAYNRQMQQQRQQQAPQNDGLQRGKLADWERYQREKQQEANTPSGDDGYSNCGGRHKRVPGEQTC